MSNSLTKQGELEEVKNKAIAEIKIKLEKALPAIIIAPIGTTADEESKEDRIKREKEIELNKKARKKSREILLNHLSENCQTNSYKPPKLQELSDEIIKFMEGKKKLEEDLKNISKKKIRKLRNKRINDSRVKNVEDSTENI
ncbi:33820_t:CDS:2, partial [Racocetra persica]